jgi:hypothetical protein
MSVESLCCLFLWFHANIEQQEFVINSLQLFSEKNIKVKLGEHQSDFWTNPSSLSKNGQEDAHHDLEPSLLSSQECLLLSGLEQWVSEDPSLEPTHWDTLTHTEGQPY